MRQLNQNKQKLYYSRIRVVNVNDDKGNKLVDSEDNYIIYNDHNEPALTEDIYEKDENGDVIYTEIDGVLYPAEIEVKEAYDPPTIFWANISFNSGETKLAEYGLDTSGYNAVISADKGKLKFDERTLIWFESEPLVDEHGRAIPESADYRVAAIKTSLNEERFFLKKRVDDE